MNKSKIVSKTLNLQHLSHSRYDPTELFRLNETQVSTYLPKEKINHRSLQASRVVDNIIKAIKNGDLNAIELGCGLVVLNKHIPFSRTLKGNIFRSLKTQVQYISPDYREKLTNSVN